MKEKSISKNSDKVDGESFKEFFLKWRFQIFSVRWVSGCFSRAHWYASSSTASHFLLRKFQNDRLTEKWSPNCLHQKISGWVQDCSSPSKSIQGDGKNDKKVAYKSNDYRTYSPPYGRKHLHIKRKTKVGLIYKMNKRNIRPHSSILRFHLSREHQKLLITFSKNAHE